MISKIISLEFQKFSSNTETIFPHSKSEQFCQKFHYYTNLNTLYILYWIFTGTAGPDFLALLQSGGLLPQTLGPPPALPVLGGRNQGPPLSVSGGGGPPPPLSAPGGGGQAANLAFDLFKNMPPPMGGSSLPPGFENLTMALGGGLSNPPPLPALPNSAISVEDLERNFVSNIQEPKVSVI